MARKDYRLIYENELGQSIEFSIWSPFFLDNYEGLDGLNNLIYSSKGLNQDGETYLSSSLDKRNIVIEGKITCNAQLNKPRMISILNPKLSGKLTVIDGEAKKHISCRVEKAPSLSIDPTPRFVLSLLSLNPFFYDEEFKVDVALWKGDLSFPIEFSETGFVFGHREQSLIVNVINPSDMKCPMRIEFRALGELENPSILNVNTGEFFKLNKMMVSGEIISVITTPGGKRVTQSLNGIEANAFNFIDEDSDFLQLEVGDNLFRYDADTNLDNLEVAIYFTPQYLGI